MEGFHHSIKVNVRFGDIDLLHHVNNAAFASILDEGRINYSKEVDPEGFNPDRIAMVLVNINLDFIASAHIFDQLEIFTRCTRIGNKSLDLEQMICLCPEGKVIVRSHSTLVSIDPYTHESRAVPEDWILKLEQFEGKQLKKR
ncbi:MAG TPA: hypothetical protein DDY68_04675 [Porphyromonadaceae bacterium]|nr:hypothetical protein [Porphyromonadaceae bacterium]